MTTELISRLETGHFAPRSNDPESARDILGAGLRVGDRIVNPLEPEAFDDAEAGGRQAALVLHTLRTVDSLRRAGSAVPGALAAWEAIVDAWGRSRAAGDDGSVAWASVPLEQRSVALALGADRGSKALRLVPKHLELLAALEERQVLAEHRLRLLRIRLALELRLGADLASVRESALKAAKRAFHESGYAIARDLGAVARVREEWDRELVNLGTDPAHPALQMVRNSEFWEQASEPWGGTVAMGAELAEPIPGAETPTGQYISTGGERGDSPSRVRFVDPNGLVSLRSGWGETERDACDETHVSIILGPVRGRDAHADPSRITYSSQGKAWLVDPVAEEAGGPEAHSVVVVDRGRYRTNGAAELVREYGDEQVDGFVIRNSMHAPVQWQRHAVFVRTGNYLVIEDTLRATNPFVAYQQWVIDAGVTVQPRSDGFLLTSDDKRVALIVSATGLRDHTVEELLDGRGRCFARRIRIPMRGTSSRAIAIVADVVDEAVFSARRVPLPGKEFTVDMRDKAFDETLVVTPEVSMVVPAGLSAEAAVSRVSEMAAAGSLSKEEALAQRLAVRTAITSVKAAIHAAGATVESRRKALEDLVGVGHELRVTGLRDHGFASALIDIAGTDLADSIADNPQVGNVRRSPLVQWNGQELLQPGYHVPVATTRDADSVPDGLPGKAIWSLDLGHLTLASYLMDGPGDILTVYFHGATDRTRFVMPRFERLRSFSSLGLGPLMLFSDPCLDLDSRMILSWFVGTEELDVHGEIARMITAYASKKGIEKVLLVGNSGGGFASLQVAAHLEGTRVVSFNPQIQIDRYVPRIADTAHWALFGRDTVADDPDNAPRMDIVKRYEAIGFSQDVVLIQNPGDDHHYQEHFLPFLDAINCSGQADRFRLHTPYLGSGHRVPPPDEYLAYVRAEAARPSEGDWVFGGLRG